MADARASQHRLKVFISYSRRDLAIADALVDVLEQADIDVVIDRRDLPYGEEWQKELADFIRTSDTVVWLVSPDSVQSKWCNWELGEVGRLNKRLVPVLIEETPHSTLPESLGKIHLLPVQGTFSHEKHLSALVDTLNTDRAWLKEATRLADRARQWQAKGRDSALLLRGSALRDAEAWSDRHPKAAPAPPSEVLDLILWSKRGQARRQRQAVIVSLAAAIGATGLALAALWQWRDAERGRGTALVATAVALLRGDDPVGGARSLSALFDNSEWRLALAGADHAHHRDIWRVLMGRIKSRSAVVEEMARHKIYRIGPRTHVLGADGALRDPLAPPSDRGCQSQKSPGDTATEQVVRELWYGPGDKAAVALTSSGCFVLFETGSWKALAATDARSLATRVTLPVTWDNGSRLALVFATASGLSGALVGGQCMIVDFSAGTIAACNKEPCLTDDFSMNVRFLDSDADREKMIRELSACRQASGVAIPRLAASEHPILTQIPGLRDEARLWSSGTRIYDLQKDWVGPYAFEHSPDQADARSALRGLESLGLAAEGFEAGSMLHKEATSKSGLTVEGLLKSVSWRDGRITHAFRCRDQTGTEHAHIGVVEFQANSYGAWAFCRLRIDGSMPGQCAHVAHQGFIGGSINVAFARNCLSLYAAGLLDGVQTSALTGTDFRLPQGRNYAHYDFATGARRVAQLPTEATLVQMTPDGMLVVAPGRFVIWYDIQAGDLVSVRGPQPLAADEKRVGILGPSGSAIIAVGSKSVRLIGTGPDGQAWPASAYDAALHEQLSTKPPAADGGLGEIGGILPQPVATADGRWFALVSNQGVQIFSGVHGVPVTGVFDWRKAVEPGLVDRGRGYHLLRPEVLKLEQEAGGVFVLKVGAHQFRRQGGPAVAVKDLVETEERPD